MATIVRFVFILLVGVLSVGCASNPPAPSTRVLETDDIIQNPDGSITTVRRRVIAGASCVVHEVDEIITDPSGQVVPVPRRKMVCPAPTAPVNHQQAVVQGQNYGHQYGGYAGGYYGGSTNLGGGYSVGYQNTLMYNSTPVLSGFPNSPCVLAPWIITSKLQGCGGGFR